MATPTSPLTLRTIRLFRVIASILFLTAFSYPAFAQYANPGTAHGELAGTSSADNETLELSTTPSSTRVTVTIVKVILPDGSEDVLVEDEDYSVEDNGTNHPSVVFDQGLLPPAPS